MLKYLTKNYQNSIVGVVYSHPTMDQKEFITDYLHLLAQRLSKERKSLHRSGDWNFNILELSKHEETFTFYENFEIMLSTLLEMASKKVFYIRMLSDFL